MTLSLLVLRKYLLHQLSPRLLYATIALLFVNVSLAGALTAFASTASLVVSHSWGWDTPFVFTQFGLKALFPYFSFTYTWMVLFLKKILSNLGRQGGARNLSMFPSG